MNRQNHINQKQQGAALITALVFMAVLTIVGVTGMRGNILDVRMQKNMEDRNIAFQAAEAAVRAGEIFIRATTARPEALTTGTPVLASNQVWAKEAVTIKGMVDQDDSWWAANADPFAGIASTAQPAAFIIEEMNETATPVGGVSGVTDVGANRADRQTGIIFYRVTGYSIGKKANTVIIVQTVYGKRYL